MANHPDHRLQAAHVAYLGATGSGKSQALKANPSIPPQGARVLLWDHARDHQRSRSGSPTHYASTPAEFQTMLAAAIRTGQGFRLGFDGPRSVDLFESWFCPLVWRILDGRTRTFLVLEELARVCSHAGEATPSHGLLWEEGRKYGLAIHATSQRPQGICKTAFENVPEMWIGQQTHGARRIVERVAGIQPAQWEQLQPLTFWHWREGELALKTIQYQP